MYRALLHTKIQAFINANRDKDIHELLLKQSDYDGVPMRLIVEQIESSNRIKSKLPKWYNTADILYPNKAFLQQSSSESTARYKSELISGETMIDITGGFGVDSYFFSGRFKKLVYCERNKDLAELAEHNFNVLKADNIQVEFTDGIDYLKSGDVGYTWLYADPSRRNRSKGKVFLLEDCEPDIPANLELIFSKSEKVMLKLSPMLDLSHAIEKIPHIRFIHLVAVDNEMKEMLIILEHGFSGQIQIRCIDIHGPDQTEFSFYWGTQSRPAYGDVQENEYLYEPNAAILKAGAFNLISSEFDLKKLHPNSHLYSADRSIDFPGRRFRVDTIIPYSDKKLLKSQLTDQQANISIRNFPGSVSDLRRKHRIKDGGDRYVFFTTSAEAGKVVLICSKE